MPQNSSRSGDIAPSRYPGERLGLPEAGPHSVGRLGRRLGAIVIDWALASLISLAFFHYDQWATLGVFALMQVLFIPTIGGSIGHRVFGMRVVAVAGGWVGVWRPIVRTVLLCIVIPALVWDSDQRGFHDKVAGTVLIRARAARRSRRRYTPAMRAFGFARDVLRSDAAGAHRVTYTELFFDLVFVFAVTQVSHVLLHEQSALSLLHTVMLAMVVWWVWMFTTWASSWLDPERGAVRALFVVLMLLGLLLASAIPEAFDGRAVLLAVSLVAMQLSRSVFTFFAFSREHPDHAANFVRIIVWHVVSGALWIAGAFLPDQARLAVWLVALAVDYIGPRLRFWTPGMGGSPLTSWNVSGAHMSERVSLFLIIALGESIVVTGAAFSTAPLDAVHLGAFLAAFAGTVLLWLLYFSHVQQRGSEYLEGARERGMIAQTAYTYIPLLLVLGIVLSAVADGLVLQRPVGASTPWTTGLLCGSAIVYLVGLLLFRRATGMRWSLTVVTGALALGVLWPLGSLLPTSVVTWTVNAVLAAVVVAEQLLNRRRAAT